MKRSIWQKSLRAVGAVLSFSVMTGLNGDMLGHDAVVVAAEDLVKDAATVEEIAKIIDLKTLPIPEGAVVTGERHLGSLNYEISGDLKPALEFQRKQLVTLGWKELSGSMTEPAYCSASFQKSNFTVTVMSYAGSTPDKKSSQVFINSIGNVNLSKLPVVKGAKSTHSTVAAAGYTTELKTAEAGDATRKLLLDSGWEPYGSQSVPPDSVVMAFKRNAIRLTVFAGAAPAQQGKVMISYSVNVMAADIPAPPNAEMVGLDDTTKTLRFESPDEYDAVAKFYQQRLAKQGWKSTTGDLVTAKDDFQRPTGVLIFRNAAKDLMTLNLERINDKTHGRMSHLTAAEVVAVEQREKAAAEKFVAENKAREEAAQTKPAAKKPAMKAGAKSDVGFPDVDALIKDAVGDALKDAGIGSDKAKKGANAAAKDVVSIPIPDNAKKVDQTRDNVLQIKLPAGKGQAAAELIRDQLLAAEWELDDDDKLTAKSGNLSLSKGRQKLSMSYVDTGFTDVSLMLIGFAAKLEQGKVDPNVKVPVAGSKPKSKPKADPDDEPMPAKKTAKKKSKPGSDNDLKAVVEPKRIEKPNRDIAKLPKLSNAAKVTIDDKPTELKHVIAYEVIQQDRWVTKIIATDKPIKQASLLAQLLKTGHDEGFNLQEPFVRVELDEQDKPNSMQLRANNTPGGVGSSDMKGEAIVESGRARGTFKLAMPGEFFKKTYDAEISFDVPVLTRHDQPAKQLAGAAKLENSGKLLVNDKPIKLASVVAYEVKTFDEKRTAIFFTEKPINMDKLKASLKKDGKDSGLFETQSQVKVEIDKDDRPAMMNLWCDGASLNSNSDLIGDVIVEDGRARGTVKLGKPSEFFGKTFSFEITFDVEVLLLPAATAE